MAKVRVFVPASVRVDVLVRVRAYVYACVCVCLCPCVGMRALMCAFVIVCAIFFVDMRMPG